MAEYHHIPVMLNEAIEYLSPQKGDNFIDCTLGGGGYTFEIAEKVGPEGKVLAIDLDTSALNNAKKKIKEKNIKNIILAHGNFKDLSKIIKKNFSKQEGIDRINGIVLDLGLSSAQLENGHRGFSFRSSALINMNFNPEEHVNTAERIINSWPQAEIERILREYGEEKFASSISKAITKQRKAQEIKTTEDLVEIIKSAIPKKYLYSRIHPATKTFQALRIAVNDEIGNLKSVLPEAYKSLAKDGRLVVISFHSLEDRIVKNFLRDKSKKCICPPQALKCECKHQPEMAILTKKPVSPSEQEIKINPRSRSAKLRAAIKL